jgi:hypothetical protein
MNKTTTSKVLLIIAAGIQSLFLITSLYYFWDVWKTFTCLFIVSFILLAVSKKKVFQIMMAFIYFAYSITYFSMNIDFFSEHFIYSDILSFVIAGVILLINIKWKNKIIIFVLLIIQIILLIFYCFNSGFSLFIRLFVDLAYYLSIDMPIIVILVESFRRLITGKNTAVEN